MNRINLLPWREHRRQARVRRWQVSMVVAVLLAGALVASWELRHRHRLHILQADNASLQAQLESLEASVQQLAELQERLEALRSKHRALARLREQAGDPLALLRHLEDVLPPGLYLTELKFEQHRLHIRGEAARAAAVADFLRALQAAPAVRSAQLHELRAGGQGHAFRLSLQLQERLS
ncbi:PilN domain-containing protein [Pseudomonas fulva]|nr:PilN domain-containing protein [Pseudomonas fulva]MBF8778793.1 PilN domain-containing protein [Pseudomonas fulva]